MQSNEPAEERAHEKVLLEHLDSIIAGHDHRPPANEGLKAKLPDQIADIQELLSGLRRTMADSSQAEGPSAAILSQELTSGAAPIASWVPGDDLTRAGLVPLDGFKSLEENNGCLLAYVGENERSQLRVHFDQEAGKDEVFCTFMIRARFENVSEPYVALRWVHGDDPEETMVRIRVSDFVAGHSVALPATPSSFTLVTIARSHGKNIVALNGVPVFWRNATTPSPTGVVVDAIGPKGGAINLDFGLFSISDIRPGFLNTNGNLKELVARLVQAAADTGSMDRASLWLYGLQDLDCRLPTDIAQSFLDANLSTRDDGYRDYLNELVLERVADEDQPRLSDHVMANAPKPSLIVEGASVEIASNPSQHASLRYLLSERPSKTRLLDDITFSAFSGDTVGIIGKNGAGKTTFLKTLVAAMPLAEGRIALDAKPVLLRPGAGMQGELTGRENIYKTGLYMGFLPHEMRELMDDIIEFAELEDHIDRPFRYYSDGMRARLIFSLATAVPREILLLDELLSAGDIGFQKKAMARLDDFLTRAKLVLVVQHTFDFVLSRCTKCLLLDHGKPLYFGDPRIATELYREML